jgi:hypothetical protein
MSSEDIIREKLGIETDTGEEKQPTPYERMLGIHESIHVINQANTPSKSLDTGHEVLLRFVEDLRVHLGWPEHLNGMNKVWWIEAQDDGARVPASYFEHTTVSTIRVHKCRVHAIILGIDAPIWFEAQLEDRSKRWSLVVDGHGVGTVDATTFDTPKDVLKNAANVLSAAVYDRAWK